MTTETPKNGLHTKYYDDGQKKSEANFKDDKLDGKYTEWYENGQIKLESNWKEEKLFGKMTYWHENGQKESEGNWKDGKKHGIFTEWDENGQKKSEENWKDGKDVEKLVDWLENGQKKSEHEKSRELYRREVRWQKDRLDNTFKYINNSKIWLICQIIWVLLVILTAKYRSYPDVIYLFHSFIGTDIRTNGFVQLVVMAFPFLTNLYFWIKK